MEVSSAEPGVLGAVGDERGGRRPRSTRRRPREAAGRMRNRSAAAGEGLVRHCRRCRTRNVRSVRDFREWWCAPAGDRGGTGVAHGVHAHGLHAHGVCVWRLDMREHVGGKALPADLDRERPVACRHESRRNEHTRRKRDQHDAGHERSSVPLAGGSSASPRAQFLAAEFYQQKRNSVSR